MVHLSVWQRLCHVSSRHGPQQYLLVLLVPACRMHLTGRTSLLLVATSIGDIREQCRSGDAGTAIALILYGPSHRGLHAEASELGRRVQVPRALTCRTPSRAQTRRWPLGMSPSLATPAKEGLQAMLARPSQKAPGAQRWVTAWHAV